ncbi:hypothetical protein SteCoe_30492 [Stentor coeruleus]|uniref:Uncharacterized protein n=1 Tax=Stentor coeruleus TaxID=5963 RepID=A0A1R2B3F7_9CILI|nr:hypothetical protein SteCoe_30492 [Stentor coeruleus]
MKFVTQEEGTAVDLLYFDSWESHKWADSLYYLSIGVLWILCVCFTLYCWTGSGSNGLVIAVGLCLMLIPCGILTIRMCIEGMLSLFVVRDHFVRGDEGKRLIESQEDQNSNQESEVKSDNQHSISLSKNEAQSASEENYDSQEDSEEYEGN